MGHQNPKWFEENLHQLSRSKHCNGQQCSKECFCYLTWYTLRGLFLLGLAKSHYDNIGAYQCCSSPTTLTDVSTSLLCATLLFLQWPTFSFYCKLERCYGNQVNITTKSFKSLLHNASKRTPNNVLHKSTLDVVCGVVKETPLQTCPHTQSVHKEHKHSSLVKVVHILMHCHCRVQ